jgi:hypothetical protein
MSLPDNNVSAAPIAISIRKNGYNRDRAAESTGMKGDYDPFGTTMLEPNQRQTTIVVSGLPRSGTSMLMAMLAAGGLPLLVDQRRPPDQHNPGGYFEHAGAAQLDRNTDWLRDGAGRAVKIISLQLYHLPAVRPYDVLFIERSLAEILASQRAMLGPTQDTATTGDEARLAALYESHVVHVKRWMATQPHMRTLFLEHRAVLENPAAAAEKIRTFLAIPIDLSAMAAAVAPALYRQRL